ncbi:hypothetical protein RRG08_037973 [Elysia crispata]|uniref:Uncharacterized protein n=1 Tax=Elysia crispata TaxID=231223 RepID=A0AAE1ADF3_9GAST|nr:hypothetical protein RRG08_037973 [Elysia crispata]
MPQVHPSQVWMVLTRRTREKLLGHSGFLVSQNIENKHARHRVALTRQDAVHIFRHVMSARLSCLACVFANLSVAETTTSQHLSLAHFAHSRDSTHSPGHQLEKFTQTQR